MEAVPLCSAPQLPTASCPLLSLRFSNPKLHPERNVKNAGWPVPGLSFPKCERGRERSRLSPKGEGQATAPYSPSGGRPFSFQAALAEGTDPRSQVLRDVIMARGSRAQ